MLTQSYVVMRRQQDVRKAPATQGITLRQGAGRSNEEKAKKLLQSSGYVGNRLATSPVYNRKE
jgi:hypothetical protein